MPDTTGTAVTFTGAATFSLVPPGVAINLGNADTSHNWSLTVVASATTVRFDNASEDEPPLVLTPVTVGHTLVVDGLARTVTDNGVAAPALVAAGSGWPALVPGGNDLVLIGAAGTFTYHPLYV